MCALLENSTINKQYLITLIGWYLDDQYLYVVTEFMPGGNLLDYLQSLRLGSGVKEAEKEEDEEKEKERQEGEEHIRRLEMHRFVTEIASGMCALEVKRIQHRDLAARNILLTRHRQIKVRRQHVLTVNKNVPRRCANRWLYFQMHHHPYGWSSQWPNFKSYHPHFHTHTHTHLVCAHLTLPDRQLSEHRTVTSEIAHFSARLCEAPPWC